MLHPTASAPAAAADPAAARGTQVNNSSSSNDDDGTATALERGQRSAQSTLARCLHVRCVSGALPLAAADDLGCWRGLGCWALAGLCLLCLDLLGPLLDLTDGLVTVGLAELLLQTNRRAAGRQAKGQAAAKANSVSGAGPLEERTRQSRG